MSYSLDLRKKVIDYVENGGSITKAAALFNTGRATIYISLFWESGKSLTVSKR
ncbi:IS630 transposase-related protein [Microcystis aeruginosa CS-338/01]|nr:IS630 transposase-related protein [Microcystis aeruginosa]MDB9506320.1 IS630 transposase-related protein [Microcystis aeruginosa CS-338/01]